MEAVAMTWDAAGGRSVPAAAFKRVATAAAGVPLFVLLILWGPVWLFQAVVVAAGAVAAWELQRLFARAGRPTQPWLGVAAPAVVTASFVVPGGPPVVLTVAVLLALAAPLVRAGVPAVEPAAGTVLATVYVGWLLGHALVLHALPEGAGLILFVVAVTWLGETAAYVAGSRVGRHRLAPVISPRKTVEGAVAQIGVSLAVAAALGVWLLPSWSAGVVLGAGLLLGVVGQIGDLVESVLKRSVGTKDAGELLPGHGGLLDRLDSLLFNLPVLFYYALWVAPAGARG
jgi:phosphatidate cytidylyltransferase